MSEPLHCSHTSMQFIDDVSLWPKHLSPITNKLRLFLPSSMDRVDTSKLSTDGLALYRELMDTSTAVPRFQVDSSMTQVTDAIDTILMSVAQLRVLARRPGMDNAKESTAIALLHIMGLICSTNAVAMAGAPFLLPRSLPPRVLERLGYEGYASLLVGIPLHTGTFANVDIAETGHTPLDGKLQTISDSTALSSTLHTGNPPFEDSGSGELGVDWNTPNAANLQAFCARSMASSDTLSSNNASVLAFDIPFDAHILPGRGVRTSCYLPALCVANETDINALMTSVAYQRHIFGISLPIVGICLHSTPNSIFARVMIGWIDGMAESCRIPSVRIATATGSTNSPSTGVFNLLDPCATVLLSQFILSLSSHIDALSSTQLAPGDHIVSWRADQTMLYSPSLNPCCMHFMAEWDDQIRSSSPQADIIANSTMPFVHVPQAELLRNVRSAATPHMDDGHPSPSANLTDTKKEETLRAPSSLLSPTFQPTSCICKDLHTRGVIVLAAVRSKIKIHSFDGEDLCLMLRVRDRVYETLALYFSITSLPQFPDDWIDGTNIFRDDPAYEYLRPKLLQEIEACRKTEPRRLFSWEKPLLHFRSEDTVGFELFLSQVSLFFLSVATARSSLLEQSMPNLQGSSRCSWDWIFQIACSELGDTLGRGNWSEHPMALPTACNKTVSDWYQLFALQWDISFDQGRMPSYDSNPGSRWIMHYFSDASFHMEGFDSAGESALLSRQNQDMDDTPIIASLLVAGDIGEGTTHVPPGVMSERPSFHPKRAPGDPLTTLAVLHRQSSQTMEQALDRCCLCMVSLLSSLKSVGLSGTTVFGVVTDRTECTLLAATQDQETGYNLVIREATVRYDLTKPLDALLLFMTLHRIFRRQLELFAPLREHYAGD